MRVLATILLWPILLVAGATALFLLAGHLRQRFTPSIDPGVFMCVVVFALGGILCLFL